MGDILIRPAQAEELDTIWAMVGRAVADMNARGNPQWGADYPTRDFYAGDISRGELYAALVDGQLAGVACINTSESPEYDPLPWTTVRPAMVIHRMAVDPTCQRSGIGSAFFRFAQEEAHAAWPEGHAHRHLLPQPPDAGPDPQDGLYPGGDHPPPRPAPHLPLL